MALGAARSGNPDVDVDFTTGSLMLNGSLPVLDGSRATAGIFSTFLVSKVNILARFCSGP